MEEPDGHREVERRHGDGHPTTLTSPACSGGCARASRPGWTRWKPGRPSGGRRTHKKHGRRRRRTIKAVYEDPRTGFGSMTLPRCGDPSISRGEVNAFLDGLRVNQDRPQRGYNSFVPLEPMNQLQVADMKAFGGKPYPFMLVAIDALTKKVAAEPLKDRLASTTAAGMKKVFQRVLRRRLRVQEGVQEADGFLGHREAGPEATPTSRSAPSAPSRRPCCAA